MTGAKHHLQSAIKPHKTVPNRSLPPIELYKAVCKRPINQTAAIKTTKSLSAPKSREMILNWKPLEVELDEYQRLAMPDYEKLIREQLKIEEQKLVALRQVLSQNKWKQNEHIPPKQGRSPKYSSKSNSGIR